MKKITLRRAAKIRNRLEGKMNELRNSFSHPAININVVDPDAAQQVETFSKTLDGVFARFLATSNALSELRTLIGKSNADNGINELVARQSALKGRLSTIAGINEGFVKPTGEQIDARIASARTMLSSDRASRYGGNDNSMFYALSADMIETVNKMKVELQTEIDDIQEKLEYSNSNTLVELPDTVISVLKVEQII
jgi:hypothetical protein